MNAGSGSSERPEPGSEAPFLEVRGLSRRFDGRVVLDALSFSLAAGEHLALTGPSGSGKTTLLRLLAGLLEPTAGVVLQAGELVSRPGWSQPAHQRGMGMLFQELALWPHLTVAEQVDFCLPRDAARGRRERRDRVRECLEEARILPFAERYPSQLSGGERQRLAWARAVVSRPQLLLLDEPLTSLDPRLRHELSQAIVGYGGRRGRTIVVATHDPELAVRVASRRFELTACAGP